MGEFEAFHEYTRDEILERLGDGHLSGAFFLGREKAACFAELGTRAGETSFPERSTFHWPAECPDAICQGFRAVDLFVGRGADRFVYVGEATVSSCARTDTSQPTDVRFPQRRATGLLSTAPRWRADRRGNLADPAGATWSTFRAPRASSF
jgi:hypothetical protein